MSKHFLFISALLLCFGNLFSQKTDYLKELKSLYEEGKYQSLEMKSEEAKNYYANRKDTARMLKSLYYKIIALQGYEENFHEKTVKLLEDEIKDAGGIKFSVLNLWMANLYLDYYRSYGYELRENLYTNNVPDNLKSWSPRLFTEKALYHINRALYSNKEYLQSVPTAKMSVLVKDFSLKNSLRPYFWEVLAYKALDILTNHNPGYVLPQDHFTIDKECYFADLQDFAKQNIKSEEALDYYYQILLILQQLSEYELNAEPDRQWEIDFYRFYFLKNHSVLKNTKLLYKQALERALKNRKQSEFAAEAYYNLAVLDTNYVNAINLCEKAIKLYPDSYGAKLCESLSNEIHSIVLNASMNSEIVPGENTLMLLSYRNLKKVYCRVVDISVQEYRNIRYHGGDGYNFCLKISKARKPSFSGSFDLPDKKDYKLHSVEVAIPPMKMGYHCVILCENENFENVRRNNFMLVYSGNIAFSRASEGETNVVYCYDRKSGHPLKELELTLEEGTKKNIKTYRSDENGIIKIVGAHKYNSIGTFKYKNDVCLKNLYYYPKTSRKEDKYSLYTDRAIYRPGQTLMYKILAYTDSAGRISISNEKKLKITLKNSNCEIVGRDSGITNAFASFSGRFVLPSSTLTGNFTLYCNDVYMGMIKVEEYKRPKFEIKIPEISGTYSLNDSIKVPVNVFTYAGFPVENAKVSYSVVRRVSRRYRWWYPAHSLPAVEITEGELKTDAEGKAFISFCAEYDTSVNLNGGQYIYTLSLTARDLTGEMHSASKIIKVAENPYNINLTLPDKQILDKNLSFPVKVTNLSDKGQSVNLDIRVYALETPEVFKRERAYPINDICHIKFVDSAEFVSLFPLDYYTNPKTIDKWTTGKCLYRTNVITSEKSAVNVKIPEDIKLSTGAYKILVSLRDSSGRTVIDSFYTQIFDLKSEKTLHSEALYMLLCKNSVIQGEKAKIYLSTPCRDADIMLRIIRNNSVDYKYIRLSNSAKIIEIPTFDGDCEKIDVEAIMCKNNRLYNRKNTINIEEANPLEIELTHLKEVLSPSVADYCSLKCNFKDKVPADAEILVSIYDASLDAFTPLNWSFDSHKFVSGASTMSSPSFGLSGIYFDKYINGKRHGIGTENFPVFPDLHIPTVQYYKYNNILTALSQGRNAPGINRGGGTNYISKANTKNAFYEYDGILKTQEKSVRSDESSNVEDRNTIRSDFRETVCFYPQLHTDKQGNLRFDIRMPDSYTRWNMKLLAYTKDMKYKILEKQIITKNPLMLTTNVPRFYREDDTAVFTVKIDNLEDKKEGVVTLKLTDTEGNILTLLNDAEKKMQLPSQGNAFASFSFVVPLGISSINYLVSIKTLSDSDAEAAVIPVLPNRVMLTETMPMYINGKESKSYKFNKLSEPLSATAKTYSLSLEFTSQPIWYAIQALPSLMEISDESIFSVFLQYYANSIGAKLLKSSPTIKEVLKTWKTLQPDALSSQLEKNSELKSVLLSETPWVMDAGRESAGRKRLSQLLDGKKLENMKIEGLRKISKLQNADGGFSWWKTCPSSPYITQFIVGSIGKVNMWGAMDIRQKELKSILEKAIAFIDANILRVYREQSNTGLYVTAFIAQYLWARSHFLEEYALGADTRKVYDIYLSLSAKSMIHGNSLYDKAMVALALERNKEHASAMKIIKTLKEMSLYNEEMGMYWRSNVGGYSWANAPIETQSMLIQAFNEVAHDTLSVRKMQTWLLKQKQSRMWNTSMATADAVYALLQNGNYSLESEEEVEIKIGSEIVKTEGCEAGSHYIKKSWKGDEVGQEMGNVLLKKNDKGIAWGSLYWQYYEDINKVSSSENSAFKLRKVLYLLKNTPKGTVLEKLNDNDCINAGDKIRVHIEIITNRDLEYVDLKDLRASCMEPVSVLSSYKYHRGLSYYQAVGDVSTHFYIEVLPKGFHVFEYDIFVTEAGNYSSGILSAQSIYAPEFSAHTKAIRLKVK